MQTDIAFDGEKIIMKIRGQLVDILLICFPGVYYTYVQYKGNQNIMYVRILKELFGMIVYSILYYKNFRRETRDIGFKVNPYNICVSKKMKYSKQQKFTWHVDDWKPIHENTKVNDKLAE